MGGAPRGRCAWEVPEVSGEAPTNLPFKVRQRGHLRIESPGQLHPQAGVVAHERFRRLGEIDIGIDNARDDLLELRLPRD